MTNTTTNTPANTYPCTQDDGTVLHLTAEQIRQRVDNGPYPFTDDAGITYGALEFGGEGER